MYNTKGLLKVKGDTKIITEKFKKRDFTIQSAEQYPQFLTFQLMNDRCSLIEQYQLGDEVEVSFVIAGKEWTSKTGEIKYFNSLNCRNISLVSAAQVQEPQNDIGEPTVDYMKVPNGVPPANAYDPNQNDLPF